MPPVSRCLCTPRNASTAPKLCVTLVLAAMISLLSSSATELSVSCARALISSATGPFSQRSCRTSSIKSKLHIDALGLKSSKFLLSLSSKGTRSQVTVAAISTSVFAGLTNSILTRESESIFGRSATWFGYSAGIATPTTTIRRAVSTCSR